MHFHHALTRAAVFFRHHGSDEAVVSDLLIQGIRKDVPVGAVHPVFAIVLLRDRIAVFVNLPLLVG